MHISRLYCYPIKSCGGITLESATVSLRGIQHDRAWAVVDLKTHRVLTQREVPKLCLVRTEITAEGQLAFSAPDCAGLQTPLDAPESPRAAIAVEIWGERVRAVDQGMWPSGWFSAFLGRHCALMRLAPDGDRRSKDGRGLAFADGYQSLIISESSLEDLNARLETPLPMDRFRPNVVVADCAPYAEDEWGMIRLGGLHAEGTKPCVRCVITTTDQRTAERAKEPLRTLATYRKTDKGVVFGRNFSFMNGGSLRIGDAVELVPAPHP